MGIGNPKSNEEQDAEQAKKEADVKEQYDEARNRRVSPEGQTSDSGERRVGGPKE